MEKAGGSGSSGGGVCALAVFNTDFFGQGFFLTGEKQHHSWSFSALASACSHYLLPPLPSHPAGFLALLHIQRLSAYVRPPSLPRSPVQVPSLSPPFPSQYTHALPPD